MPAFDYEVTLRLRHTEEAHPDMPSLNARTVADELQRHANTLIPGDLEAISVRVEFLGEVDRFGGFDAEY